MPRMIWYVCYELSEQINLPEWHRPHVLRQIAPLRVLTMSTDAAQMWRDQVLSIDIYHGPKGKLGKAAFVLWALTRLRRGGRRAQESMVYTTFQSPCTLVGALSKLLFGVKWVADLWDDPQLEVEQTRRHPGGRWLLQQIIHRITAVLRRADLSVVALADPVYQQLLPASRTIRLTNGVDVEGTRQMAAARGGMPVRLNDGRRLLVYVGYVWRNRGVGEVVEAYHCLPERHLRSTTLLLIGPYDPQFKQWVMDRTTVRNPKASIVLTGRLPHAETLRLVGRSTVGLFPFEESQVLRYIYPVKVLEYMSLGLPVVSTALAGVMELLGDQGHYYDTREQLVSALRTILETPEHRVIYRNLPRVEWNAIDLTLQSFLRRALSTTFAH